MYQTFVENNVVNVTGYFYWACTTSEIAGFVLAHLDSCKKSDRFDYNVRHVMAIIMLPYFPSSSLYFSSPGSVNPSRD